MEKSHAHWRAAHPLIFISSALCIGYSIASQIPIPTNSFLTWSLSTMLLSIIILLLTKHFLVSNWIQGILVLMILISWGGALYLATQKQDLLNFPYPHAIIIKARQWMILKINKSIPENDANGFAQALLMGVKTDINKDILKAYTQLGIIHIIAISGMHLDILFKNALFITHWLPRKKFWLGLELVMILSAVWIYTFIAYASPSVVRASLFFSIYFIGTFLNQPRYTLNCIAAGLFIILFFDIHSIHHIGLQLSYAAVMGIHLFYPLFDKMLPMDNIILKWMWRNMCVSFAAQLTTLPILLFHFHQLSTLVIISNFIMVPLSTLLLYALFALMLAPHQMQISAYLGNWIQHYIQWLNKGVVYFYEQAIGTPFVIQMSALQVLGYYAGLFLVYLWLYQRKAKYLIYSLVILTVFSLIKLFSP